jgi:glycosyltransferase involved in cell wall biosynthesis
VSSAASESRGHQASDADEMRDAGAVPGALFLVWGPPSHGPRSRVLARELGIDISFVHATERRGLLIAPLKYGYQAPATLVLLLRRRPGVVFVQSPPSLAVLVVALYAAVTGTRFIVDAHSDAMLSPIWTRPRWLYRLLARRALATVVTNEHFAATIRSWDGRALVLRDIPTAFPTGGSAALDAGFHVLVVNTFADDEPLAEVLAAAATSDGVTFHVTGNTHRAPAKLLEAAPRNVRFTGFLPDVEYYALMRACDAVLCLTTRDHTMQRGACEALSVGRPIITSRWPLLRSYFRQGTVHVDNTAAGIHAGVEQMRVGHPRYEREIQGLQAQQREEWTSALTALLAPLRGGSTAPAMTGGS